MNQGILVGESARTNLENVFAAGDVAEAVYLISGKRQIIATWSNACIQGRVAGLNMAGYPGKSNGGLNGNITSVFGLILATIGLAKFADGDFEELKYVDGKREI